VPAPATAPQTSSHPVTNAKAMLIRRVCGPVASVTWSSARAAERSGEVLIPVVVPLFGKELCGLVETPNGLGQS
jgi:hypothetical protein